MSKIISNIVFTRNRPLQLDAYLESLHRRLPPEKVQTYIIYKVELFDKQYGELFSRFPDCIVVREEDFHDDFMKVFEMVDTEYILFGTDDMVYFDSVDLTSVLETFERFGHEVFGFTLKYDADSLRGTPDVPVKVGTDPEHVYKINWKKAQNRHAAYPFDVSCTFYKTALVREILTPVAKERPLLKKVFAKDSLKVRLLKRIVSMKSFLLSLDTFHDPNELEGYCYRWCKTHKRRFPTFVFFQKRCVCPIQVNRVNTTVANPTCGTHDHTVEALNRKYIEGYRLDIQTLENNKPKSFVVDERNFRLKKRE